jgi:hypothetical protein
VLSTPPAFVLSQDQTLQTKTPTTQAGESNQNNLNPTKQHQKTGITKTTPQHGKLKRGKKTTTKTKPPNTLLSSQTTPVFGQPCYCTPSQKRRQTARPMP